MVFTVLKKLSLSAILLTSILIPPIQQNIVLSQNDINKTSYKAITYNIHRGMTKDNTPSLEKIASNLKKENPDFIALQEIDRHKGRSGFIDEINILSKQLNMYYVFGPNIQNGISAYGNGILSQYPILDWGQVNLARETEPRSLLWAKIKTNNGILYITSIHLGLDRVKRADHFALIEDFTRKLKEPYLLMGDFNSLPSQQAFSQFRARITGKLFYQTVPTFINRKPIQIDYIFGSLIDTFDMYTIPSAASDHYPLVIKFRFHRTTVPDNQTIKI